MRIIMSEWHQVERRMGLEITVDEVNDVYPDMTAEEVEQRYEELKSGEYAVEDFIGDAENQDIYFDWDWLDEDDWWTMRKGGYDVTYEVEDTEDD